MFVKFFKKLAAPERNLRSLMASGLD